MHLHLDILYIYTDFYIYVYIYIDLYFFISYFYIAKKIDR